MERMLRKTGRDIYKLRKTKTASKGQPDVQAFKEKMAFVAALKNEVPLVIPDEDLAAEDEAREVAMESTTMASGVSVTTIGYREAAEAAAEAEEEDRLTGSLSSETVNTLTEEDQSALAAARTAKSARKADRAEKAGAGSSGGKKRYNYEIDPDIGVIV